jgi:hypothetical protein
MSEDKNVMFWALLSPRHHLQYDLVYFPKMEVCRIAGPVPKEGGAITLVKEFNCPTFEDAKKMSLEIISWHETTLPIEKKS